MGSLFILFPVALILGIVMHRSYRESQGQNKAAASFRNFFLTWGISAGLVGVFTVFFGSTLAADLAVAFGVPFVYFAGATLIPLPFLLYRKGIWLGRLLSLLVVIWGIIVGVLIYMNVTDTVAAMGSMGAVVERFFVDLHLYHLVALSLIFVPIGLFFLRESLHSSERASKMRMALIGIGIIIAGVVEGFSLSVAAGTDFNFPDYVVPVGFLIILMGILYPRIAQRQRQ